MQINEIKLLLQKELDPKRYEHTIGVMYTAAALAMRENADIEQAMMAGLLHDCAKCIPHNIKFQMCEEYQIELTQIERENPALIHAKLGAVLAKEIYQINDQVVLDAIVCHTTGKPNMNLIEKILYLADAIEPNRKMKHLIQIRKLAFVDIDASLYELLRGSVWYLEHTDRVVDDMTQKTYEYYSEIIKRRTK